MMMPLGLTWTHGLCATCQWVSNPWNIEIPFGT
jgi:hypothetical protein